MKQIGKYKIIKELGAGGFGAVYLAEDPRLGEKVAIKVFEIRDDNAARMATSATADASTVLKERFLNEARTLRKLNRNSHIVDVFEFDELEDGTPYYVMPYLPRSLRNVLGSDATDTSVIAELDPEDKPRQIPVAAAIGYLEQLLKGLSDVHKAGLVHRDIKPANLLINEHGEVQLCDFGIAKVPDTEHSNSGIGMGSRNYMSPEQRQSAKHVDARSDIYSAGVLAYRMITGTLPEGRFAEPQKYQPALSDGLNDLILTALEQKKEDRFADGTVMLSALRSLDGNTNSGVDENTGTWVGGTDEIKPELKPLEQKIIQLLQSKGEVRETDLPILQALADLGGLSAEELHTLITQVAEQQASQSPHQKAFQQWVANINSALSRGESLSPQQQAVLIEAGEASTNKPTATLCNILSEKGITASASTAHTESNTASSDADVTMATSTEQASSGGAGKWLGMAALLIILGSGGYFGFDYYQQMQEQEKQAAVAKKNEQSAWEQAKKLNTVQAYDLYLKNWPQGSHLNLAKQAKAELEEQARLAQLSAEERRTEQVRKAQGYLKQLGYVVAENGKLDTRTQKAIEAFEASEKLMVTGAVDTILITKLKTVADEKQRAAELAEAKQQDDNAWRTAQSANTIKAYNQYLSGQPQGQYLARANAAIKNIEIENSKVPLIITTTPSEATIQITNIIDKYINGIKLLPGEYTVKISRKGYETKTETVRLTNSNNRFNYTLERAPPEPIIALINSMKPIPAGSFMMGCSPGDSDCFDAEMPLHNVNIKAFSMMATEVTRGQFTAFVDATGYRTDAEKNAGGKAGCYAFSDDQWQWTAGVSWRNAEYKGLKQANNHPVVCVSHNDATEFIRWLSAETGIAFRLPSEAEWEYAARAGSGSKYTFGNDSSGLCRFGNVADSKSHPDGVSWNNRAECNDGHVFTAPVAQYQPNAFGLYDMHGNVWEWTADYWNNSYSSAPTDGSAWLRGDGSRRVLRGGSWDVNPVNERASNRFWNDVANRFNSLGFRLAQD